MLKCIFFFLATVNEHVQHKSHVRKYAMQSGHLGEHCEVEGRVGKSCILITRSPKHSNTGQIKQTQK